MGCLGRTFLRCDTAVGCAHSALHVRARPRDLQRIRFAFQQKVCKILNFSFRIKKTFLLIRNPLTCAGSMNILQPHRKSCDLHAFRWKLCPLFSIRRLRIRQDCLRDRQTKTNLTKFRGKFEIFLQKKEVAQMLLNAGHSSAASSVFC